MKRTINSIHPLEIMTGTGRALLLALVFAVVTTASPALMAREAGQLLFVHGDVSVVGADQRRRVAERGDTVNEGERVVTGRQGAAQIRLTDDSLVALRAGSDYLFEEQNYDENDSSLSAQAGRLFSGMMRKVTGAIGRQDSGNVRQSTPVATIGIRGTEFQMIHVPEEGLPDFPGVAPGTYLLVDEGEVDVFNDAGQAVVAAGDVVYVADANTPPVPAPRHRVLFRVVVSDQMPDDEELPPAELADQGDQGWGDDEIDARLNETLSGRMDLDFLPFELVGATLVFFQDFGEGSGSVGITSSPYTQDPSYEYEFSGSGEGRILTGWSETQQLMFVATGEVGDFQLDPELGSEMTVEMLTDPDAEPVNTGYHRVRNRDGGIAGEIIWGTWQEGDYAFDNSMEDFTIDTRGALQYMVGSQAVGWSDGQLIHDNQPIELAGNYRYDYVGGSGFVASFPGISDQLLITDGHIDVDFFASDLSVLLDMHFLLDDDRFQLDGSGSIAQFHGAVEAPLIELSQSGGMIADQYSGTIMGYFTGEGADGIISFLDIEQLGEGTTTFLGTAAFQNSFLSPPDPLPADGGNEVAISSYLEVPSGTDVRADVLRADESTELFFSGSGETRVMTGWTDGTRTLATDEADLVEPGYYAVNDGSEGVASEINWGIWEGYSVEPSDFPADPWQYMVGTEALDQAALMDLALELDYSYRYVGGTGLLNQAGDLMEIDGSSQIEARFGAMEGPDMFVDLTLLRNGDGYGFVGGSGSFADFYNGTLMLSGASITEQDINGEMIGSFVGAGAEGIVSHIQLEEAFGDLWTGTAAFADRQLARD